MRFTKAAREYRARHAAANMRQKARYSSIVQSEMGAEWCEQIVEKRNTCAHNILRKEFPTT